MIWAQAGLPDANALGSLLGPFALTVGAIFLCWYLITGKLRPGADSDEWKKVAQDSLAVFKESIASAKVTNDSVVEQARVIAELRGAISDLVAELKVERAVSERSRERARS